MKNLEQSQIMNIVVKQRYFVEDVLNVQIKRIEALKDWVLALYDEIHEFKDAIVDLEKAQMYPTQFADKKSQLNKQVDEEYIDCWHFIINLLLYYVNNVVTTNSNNRIDYMTSMIQEAYQHYFELDEKYKTGGAKDYHYFELDEKYKTGGAKDYQLLTKAIENLRLVLRATPWKPWKQTQQLKSLDFIINMKEIMFVFFRLSRATTIQTGEDFMVAYNKKMSINLTRQKMNY